MAKGIPTTVFLVETTPQLTAVFACLAGLDISNAIVFVERNISFGWAAMDPLLVAARERFPTVRFIELKIQRPLPKEIAPRKMWKGFLQKWQAARYVHQQWDECCRSNFQMSLEAFGAQVQEVFFTSLLDYVLVFLAASKEKARVFYPHGFDHPRRQQIENYSYLVRRRSVKTAIQTLWQQKKHFGNAGLLIGFLGRVMPSFTTVSLPFTGVNRVLTFRSDIDFVPNEVMRVPALKQTFGWLLDLQPWSDILRGRRRKNTGDSLLLLLGEYNSHPIWEKNRNYGPAHLRLLQAVSQVTGLKRISIKAHVRSDGSAADWLAGFLKNQEKEWNIEVLPMVLSGLPVESLTLTGEFAAACSLGSCSLPPGLGFGMPHYVSLAASILFDHGWQDAFWVKFADAAQVLIEEGICRDVDKNPAFAACGTCIWDTVKDNHSEI
ncbi:MAG TPA: hypothetical protein VFW05_18630 [Verrucomicrobiae bacterium]|nr:hypothetical protein [Verrucomicrobiae bacterium]